MNRGKDRFYRTKIGRFVGHRIILDCNDFVLTKPDGKGRRFVLLKNPQIIKISGVRLQGNLAIGHLWVEYCGECAEFMSLARKIRVEGYITEYVYKEKGTVQAGVRAHKISIRKYKREIAKKYHLDAGRQLPNKVMKKLAQKYSIM